MKCKWNWNAKALSEKYQNVVRINESNEHKPHFHIFWSPEGLLSFQDRKTEYIPEKETDAIDYWVIGFFLW